MGTRGPVPKRSDQRRRRNPNADGLEVTHLPAALHVPKPAAPKHWHPIAKRLLKGLKDSGQSALYEPSDWAVAYLLCEAISRELNPQPIVVTGPDGKVQVKKLTMPVKGTSLNAYLKALSALMATEGDRRRLRIELERPKPGEPEEEADVLGLDSYRDRIPPAPPTPG